MPVYQWGVPTRPRKCGFLLYRGGVYRVPVALGNRPHLPRLRISDLSLTGCGKASDRRQ